MPGYTRRGQEARLYDFGTCIAPLVGLRSSGRSDALRQCDVQRSVRPPVLPIAQVPFFQRYEARSRLEFSLRKESPVLTSQQRMAVLAFNVAGGIGDGWRRDGLSLSSPIACGLPRPCSFPGNCSTIWLYVDSCARLDATTHFTIDQASEFSETTALLVFNLRAMMLPEATYNFTAYLPVSDGQAWSFLNMSGIFVVTAVADPTQSPIRVCQAGLCSDGPQAQFETGPRIDKDPITVLISATDLDGYKIRRSGEIISIRLLQAGFVASAFQAIFSSTSDGAYVVDLNARFAGEYLLDLQTALGNSTKFKLTLVCPAEHDVDVHGVCTPLTCSNASHTNTTWFDPLVSKCKRFPQMGVLSTSRRLRILVFKTASSKNASDLLEVRLVSGDVDSRYPVTWSATPNAHWITMSVLAGAVATERPVAEAIVTADSSGYPDANGPLISSIVVRSRSNAPRFASNAEDVDTENLSIDVQMIVKALAVLNHADVVIITSRGDALTAPDGNWNVKVEAKSSMLIVVKAFDCEALPINFTEQQFQLQLDGPTGVKNVSLMHSGANQYEVELTGSVLDQTGPYKLTLSVGEIEAEGFTLSDSRYVLCYLLSPQQALWWMQSGCCTTAPPGWLQLCRHQRRRCRHERRPSRLRRRVCCYPRRVGGGDDCGRLPQQRARKESGAFLFGVRVSDCCRWAARTMGLHKYVGHIPQPVCAHTPRHGCAHVGSLPLALALALPTIPRRVAFHDRRLPLLHAGV